MPLNPRASVSHNISELHTGKTYAHTERKFGKKDADKQAVAIALETARKVRASGGFNPKPPWYVRREAGQMMHTGPIISAIPGRTDRHNMNVPSGSYVLPAETVSHMGQSNSIAGLARAKALFGPTGPYGAGVPKMAHGSSMPHLRMGKLSEGGARGSDKSVGSPVPVVTAGGEFIIPPEIVRNIGKGDIKRGHAILDRFVMDLRKQHIATLRALKPPSKD